MQELQELSAFVEEQVSKIPFPETPSNLYDPLRYFMTLGGKRMRPILTLMGADLFGVSRDESIHAAIAIELFHNFSLIHDDIMDLAPVRRGKPTVHEKWNQNIAILSGDVLLVEAYQRLTSYSDHRLSVLLRRFNETAKEVCEGQQMDMDFETSSNVTSQEYIEMIRLKTSVLLGCALEFGAILGNQDEEMRKYVFDFGVSLGIAFQIQDDILDLYADPEKFGKQVGGDILSNKKTLLLITALKTDDPRVTELLNFPPNEKKIQSAQQLFTELGITLTVNLVMDEYYSKAMESLSYLDKKGLNTTPLKSMAEFLIKREH